MSKIIVYDKYEDEGGEYLLATYQASNGRKPFLEWVKKLTSSLAVLVWARVWRFRQGNFGDHRHLGGGLYEARLKHGPGIRLYFGIKKQQLVVLLVGGDKKRQNSDIEKARGYWNEIKN